MSNIVKNNYFYSQFMALKKFVRAFIARYLSQLNKLNIIIN